MVSMGRPLLRSDMPRSHLNVTGKDGTIVISGVEVMEQIRGTTEAKKYAFTLNPSITKVFPRLSGYSKQYEKYRFLSVKLRYHPACPATQSGAVGMLITTEYQPDVNEVPTFLPDLASYEFGAANTIANAFSTKAWVPRDKRYYWISGRLDSSSPLDINQGSMCFVTKDAGTDDNEKLAGYVSIEYQVEFVNAKPTEKQVINQYNQQQPVPPAGVILDQGNVTNEAGDWLSDSIEYLNSLYTSGSKVYGDIKTAHSYATGISALLSAASAGLTTKTKSISFDDHARCVWFHPEHTKVGRMLAEQGIEQKLPPMPEAKGDYMLELRVFNNAVMGEVVLYAESGNSIGTHTFYPMIDFRLDWSSATANYDLNQPNIMFWKLTTPTGDVRNLSRAVFTLADTKAPFS
jgi:hypothetical protein